MTRYADGAIVGSAIVKQVAAKGAGAVSDIGDFVEKMKAAVRS